MIQDMYIFKKQQNTLSCGEKLNAKFLSNDDIQAYDKNRSAVVAVLKNIIVDTSVKLSILTV
jgi:hypothetical protein